MRIPQQAGQCQTGRRIATWVYQSSLAFYPECFRNRFGSEMAWVFEEALDEQAQKGWPSTLAFLGREFIEVPVSIIIQHFLFKKFWLQSYLKVILAFTFGFSLLGLMELLLNSADRTGIPRYLMVLTTTIVAGGLAGLSFGIILTPNLKKILSLCGMAVFLLLWIFPNFLVGCSFYLILGITLWSRRDLLRLAAYGSLALVVAFFVNRLSAALVQSYVFHSPSQALAQTGPTMILIPYLCVGLSLGLLLGRIAPQQAALKA